MSGTSYSANCPRCLGVETMNAYSDHKPFDGVSGTCLRCGFDYWTASGVASKEYLDEIKVDTSYEGEEEFIPDKELSEHIKSFDLIYDNNKKTLEDKVREHASLEHEISDAICKLKNVGNECHCEKPEYFSFYSQEHYGIEVTRNCIKCGGDHTE